MKDQLLAAIGSPATVFIRNHTWHACRTGILIGGSLPGQPFGVGRNLDQTYFQADDVKSFRVEHGGVVIELNP
jgi:hypothetical protein